MQLSDKVYILILLIVILGLSLVSYWRFHDFNNSLSEIKLPEINLPETNLDDFISKEKEIYKNWTSPDGRLKLEYSTNWTELNELLPQSPDQSGIDLIDSEVLFFAHQLKIEEQTLAFLTVNKFDTKKTLEEIVEEIERTVDEQGRETEIVDIKNEDEITWLEIISKQPDQPNLYSKGKLIVDEDKTYLILFTVQQTAWPSFEEEIKTIFDSVQLSS